LPFDVESGNEMRKERKRMSTPTDRLVDHDSPGERRFYPRVTPARPLYIPFGVKNLGMLLNLSENGLLVSTPEALDLNSVFKISIRLNGLPKGIDVQVRTVWTSESNRRAGIQLLDLSDHDREQIRKWSALEASRGGNTAVPQETPTPRTAQERPALERPAAAPIIPPLPASLPERPPIPAFLAPLPVSSDPARLAPFPPATQLEYPAARTTARRTKIRRKSSVPALVAWGAVGAVVCLGAALFLDRGLAEQLLHRSGLNPIEVGAPVTAENPASVSGAENVPASNPQPVSDAKPTFRRAVSRLESQEASTLASPLPMTTEPAREVLNRDAFNSIDPAASAKRAPVAYADSSSSAHGQADTATATTPKLPNATPASANPDAGTPNKTPEPSAVKAVTAPSASVPTPTSSNAAPTTTANSVPVPSGPSAIAGSIGNTNSASAMNSSAPTHPSGFVPSALTSVPVAANPSPAGSNSVWPALNTPIAAGKTRNSLFHSRPVDSSVVQMDVNPGPAMAITPPRGIGSSYVTIPGERVIDSAGLTLHLRRAVRVPAEHWIWRNKKQVALGELATRIDPQPVHQPASGSITVQATIDKEGRVTDLKPLNGSFSFLPGVARAVREWRYEPTFLDGKPVETRADIEIDFHSPASAQR
jgi:hypothetical protein